MKSKIISLDYYVSEYKAQNARGSKVAPVAE